MSESVITVCDPHHEEIQWKYENGKFYHNAIGTKRWTEMKNILITTKRIKALFELIKLNEK